jgi:hypothetical protein
MSTASVRVSAIVTSVIIGLPWIVGEASAEVAAPTTPTSVYADTVGDIPVTWVDWGAAGPARARDSAMIVDEHDSLRRFLHAPEFKAEMIQLAKACQQTQKRWLREHLERLRVEYCQREQSSALPVSERQLHEVLPLPCWAFGLPMSVRDSTQILIFDDRDPRQRSWVLRHAHDQDRLSYAYCTAWTSGDDRDRFWKEHPMLGIHPVATDQFAQFYGLTSYPALVRFGLETMDLEQGLAP